MIVVFLVFLCVLLGIGSYINLFLKRMCRSFGYDFDKLWVKRSILCISLCLTAVSLFRFGTGMVFFLYIIMIDLCVRFINYLMLRFCPGIYKNACLLWKKIYGCGIIPIVLTVLILVYGRYNLMHVTETDYTVYTEKDIREEGYRVAFLADVHYGVSLNYEELLEECKEISNTHPDIVILGGDMVDNSTSTQQIEEVFQALGTIQSKYGTFFVYGNHDRPMDMVKSDYTEAELFDAISGNDIRILEDDLYEVNEEFVLIGRKDRSEESGGNGRASAAELIEQADQDQFLLTIDHQPNDYEENGEAGTDLLLSGHTHGGQIFPGDIVQKLIKFNDGVYGCYQIDEDTQAIVTSGFAGWNYPVKTAGPAEYVIIDIKNR